MYRLLHLQRSNDKVNTFVFICDYFEWVAIIKACFFFLAVVLCYTSAPIAMVHQ